MIVKTATCKITFAGPAVVDLSDYVIAADVQSPASAVDSRTFGAAHATDSVVGVESVTLALRWSDALMTALDAKAGLPGALAIVTASGGETIAANVIYEKVPFSRFQIGEQVECDLVLAVTSQISWS